MGWGDGYKRVFTVTFPLWRTETKRLHMPEWRICFKVSVTLLF